ncbi:MAG: PilZ domain-containing protein [Deltaproteobacteria bacterium]|nr:PilZ domain-containing protein [Deltaproteobacteria bacterium]
MATQASTGTGPVKTGRRRYTRLPCRVTVQITEAEGEGHLLFTSVNLSLGGVFLESELLLEVGSILKLAFRLPDSDVPTEASAVVVRVSDEDSLGRMQPGMGLEFTSMAPAGRMALEAWLRDRLVALRKDARGSR